MKKLILIILTVGVFTSCEILEEFIQMDGKPSGRLTEQEIAQGLKEALNVGIDKAVAEVSKTNGFYRNPEIKIPFPQEAQRVKEVCESVGLSRQVTEFEEKLNRAAELASKEATEVFKTAIRQMTIRDAMSILQGSEDEATQYLKRTSTRRLYTSFYPIVENANEQIMLARYWTPLVERYNSVTAITGGQQVDTDLNNYVTEKAIEGLFIMLAKEESKIRKDPRARINDILRKVFGSEHNPFN